MSDVNSPLITALGKLHSESPKIRLRLHASKLDEVERGVVEGRLIVGIVPVYQRREEFDYFALYEEKAHAYCAVGHPLFNTSEITPEVLRQYEVVNHRYAIHRDKANFVNYDSQSTSASQVEAVAILILTGRFLGFLPEHYATPLVREGRLRALCPEQVHLSTAFNLILRHNAPRSPMVKAFATALGVDFKATA